MKGGINSSDLLTVADSLLHSAAKSPGLEIAHRRRAISTAYYALFHELIGEATQRMMGAESEQQVGRSVIARWYTHSEIRKASQWVIDSGSGRTIPKPVRLLFNKPSSELLQLAKSFIELQKIRHRADYDNSKTFTQQDAEEFIKTARKAISLIPGLRKDSVYRNYLLLLMGVPKAASQASQVAA